MANNKLFNQIISYGLQNKRSKSDIMSALINSDQFDIATAATSLKSLDDMKLFDYGEQKEDLNAGGPTISSATASDLGDSKAAKEMISSLESSISGKAGGKAFAPITGNLRSLNPWDTDVQSIQSQINATKQIVGKYLEGGVLRLEDEKKYEKILPKIGDTQEVAKAKIEQVKKLIDEKFKSQTQTLGQAGYDISGFGGGSQESAPGFIEAMDYARKNPNDPNSQKLIQAIRSGQIDPITGQKKEAVNTQETSEQKPTDQTQPAEEKDSFLSRLWNATKEVVPELGEDVGNRIKNIWSNIIEPSQKSDERSIFENVLRSNESMFKAMGEAAGLVGDIGAKAVEFAYKAGVPKETQDKIKQTASDFIQTETGQKALQVLQSGAEAWNEFKKNNPNVAKDLEASFNIITAYPIGKAGKAVGGEIADVASDVSKIVSKGTVKNIENASKETFKAIKPSITVGRNKKVIRESLNAVNDEIIARGMKPTNVKEYADAIAQTKKQVWTEIESKLASGSNSKVNLREIADKLIEMADSPTLMRADKNVASKIKKMAENIISNGDEVSVLEAEQLKQFINSELSGAFGKFTLSNAEQNAKKLITKEIGQQLDKVLSSIPGEFSGLKKKYGALREIEEDVLKRLIVFERQNPQGLVESVSKISGVGNILKGLIKLSPADIAKGAGELALGQIQRRSNDADQLVKRAFEKLYKSKGSFSPKSKTFKTLSKMKPGLNINDLSKDPEIINVLKDLGYRDNFQDFMQGIRARYPELEDELGDKNLLELFKRTPEIMGEVMRLK